MHYVYEIPHKDRSSRVCCLYCMKIRFFVASGSDGVAWMDINEVGVLSFYNLHIQTLWSIM